MKIIPAFSCCLLHCTRLISTAAWIILCLTAVSCDWFSRTPDDAAPAASGMALPFQNADEMARQLKTLEFDGSTWEHYLTASGSLWRSNRKLYAFAYLRAGASVDTMTSALVLAPAALPAKGKPELIFREFPGTIFELHLIRISSALDAQLLYTVSIQSRNDSRVLSSTYWDVQPDPSSGMRFQEIWRVTHAYEIQDARNSYRPPDFHYWDVDDDGLQEIIVTNTWKDKPPPWKYRWAVFHWDPKRRRMEARRGLALFPFKEQHPEWMALGIVEMQRLGLPENESAPYFSSMPGCEMKNTLQIIKAFEGTLASPQTLFRDKSAARVRLDAAPSGKKGEKESEMFAMRIEFELRNEPSEFDRWRICRAQLYRLKTAP